MGGADKTANHNDAAVEKYFCEFGDAPDVLLPVLKRITKVLAQSRPDDVPIENSGEITPFAQFILDHKTQGGFPGAQFALEADNIPHLQQGTQPHTQTASLLG
jgi:hypothetical protein